MGRTPTSQRQPRSGRQKGGARRAPPDPLYHIGFLQPTNKRGKVKTNGKSDPRPSPRVTPRSVGLQFLSGALEQSPVLPFACCVGSLHSDGRCGRCSL